ncbi:hypothetical protein SLEP1_g15814 [Rubroshorea leprosula]|uniref:Uncharacterized protein n=1 Tax=Rubroshorea leprosula TaxID=152421 RepID=A0AAV5IY12_9ROSI|nr:hypothetical protein SLEP1_g15814 [Rubroshorea leprosula]
MVKFFLMIAADFENIARLQLQNGIDDPSFSYLFKVEFAALELRRKYVFSWVKWFLFQWAKEPLVSFSSASSVEVKEL